MSGNLTLRDILFHFGRLQIFVLWSSINKLATVQKTLRTVWDLKQSVTKLLGPRTSTKSSWKQKWCSQPTKINIFVDSLENCVKSSDTEIWKGFTCSKGLELLFVNVFVVETLFPLTTNSFETNKTAEKFEFDYLPKWNKMSHNGSLLMQI